MRPSRCCEIRPAWVSSFRWNESVAAGTPSVSASVPGISPCGPATTSAWWPLRAATQDEIPDANAIRRFRRLNREAIHQTLEKWYRKLRKARPTTEVMPGAEPPVPPPVIAATPAVPSDGNTSFIVKREASERLDKAAFIDNMEKD